MNEMETKKKRPKTLFIGAVLLICVAGLGWSLWTSHQQQKELEKQLEMYRTMQIEPEEKPEGIVKEAAPVITSDTVNEKLNSLSELVAKEYLYTNADQFENNLEVKGFNIPFTTKSFTVAYDGRITASVDLSQAQVTVEEDNRKITITLPASQIMSNEIFEDSVRVFNEKDNLFNKITIDNYNEFVVKQKEAMEEKAIEMGVLTGADEEARAMVESFLSVLPGMTGEDAYTLEIK